MDALVFAVLLLGLAAFVAAPLYRAPRTPAGTDRTDLEAERDAVVGALRELELDHTSGLVETEDYARDRDTLEAKGAAIMRQLEGPSVD